MKNKHIRLKQLDQQLIALKNQGAMLAPEKGWVRTIRQALGMTIKQLAIRLGVDPSRVVKIETSEKDGAVTVRTLRTVASKLGCYFAYQFIPETRLEELIKKRARKIAVQSVQKTAYTMDLEAQSVEKQWLEDQITEMTYDVLQKSWKHLWEE